MTAVNLCKILVKSTNTDLHLKHSPFVLRVHSVNFLLYFILLISTPSSHAADAINIITNNWSSQVVLSHVAGELFRQQGYQVTFIDSPVSEQWGALNYGIAHVQVEVWQGTMGTDFDRLVAQNRIINMGDHTATTREEWWYPEYVEKLCPGLPDWKALKACSALFSPDGKGRGIYVAGPWEKPDAARIRALDLNFKVQRVTNGDDLWVALKKANETKQPIVLFNWSPNWVESRFAGKFIEFPTYHPDCESDPKWGINPIFLHDCGNPKDGWLKKAAWTGFQKKWPCAYFTLKKMDFNNLQIATATAYVDVDGLTPQAAAKRWMLENSNTWRTWLDKRCLP